MSWWSDDDPFDEREGCEPCRFNKCPSKRTCEDCKSGDFYNLFVDWDKYEECDDE